MVLSARGALCGFVVALGAGTPGIAAAVAPPDSIGLAALQSACDSAWRVRVITGRGVYQMQSPALDAGGITIPPPRGRAALITIGDVRGPGRRLSWAEIERVQGEQPKALRGAALGFVVGAALGAGMVATVGPDLTDTQDHLVVTLAVLLTLGFTGLGLLMGAGNPAVHPLYP